MERMQMLSPFPSSSSKWSSTASRIFTISSSRVFPWVKNRHRCPGRTRICHQNKFRIWRTWKIFRDMVLYSITKSDNAFKREFYWYRFLSSTIGKVPVPSAMVPYPLLRICAVRVIPLWWRIRQTATRCPTPQPAYHPFQLHIITIFQKRRSECIYQYNKKMKQSEIFW